MIYDLLKRKYYKHSFFDTEVDSSQVKLLS